MTDSLTPADLHTYKPENYADWARWPGPDLVPASWYAINPETKERTKVYRSYGDYCED